MSFIILDRDGVINFESEDYIKSVEEWTPIPHSLEAIATLNQYGFKVLIATNQSGVGRGYYDHAMLQMIHHKLITMLAAIGGSIEDIFYCPHHPQDHCTCRKPKPGLIHQMMKKYPLQPEKTFFIGDSYVDIQAARAVGCTPLLVLTGNGQKTMQHHPELAADVLHFPDLSHAVQYVVQSLS